MLLEEDSFAKRSKRKEADFKFWSKSVKRIIIVLNESLMDVIVQKSCTVFLKSNINQRFYHPDDMRIVFICYL